MFDLRTPCWILIAACGGAPAADPPPIAHRTTAAPARMPFACFAFPKGETMCATFDECPALRTEMQGGMMGPTALGPCNGVEHMWCTEDADGATCSGSMVECERERAQRAAEASPCVER